jgi:predicted amidohydrolase YtcJ
MRARSRAALALAGAVVAAAPAAAQAAARPAADTVFRNGYVRTVDARDSVRQALAVRDGKIVWVGSDKGARAWIGKRTKVVNLRGKMVMPGLHDGHTHTLSGGAAINACNLDYAPLTVAQFQQEIQGCLDRTSDKEPDGWMVVSGWYRQAMQPAGTDATRATLDALRTSRPIVVNSSDGHTNLANSKALQLAGITAQTPDPDGGQIIRDASGEPTGILEDSAGGIVDRLIPPPTAAEDLEAARAALDAFRRQGVTSFMDQFSGDATAQAFETLRKRGQLTARVALAPGMSQRTAAESPAKAVAPVFAMRRKWETGPITARPGLRVRNVGELTQDGVLQAPAQTASFLEPYFVNAGTDENPNWVPGTNRGPDPYWTTQQLADVTTLLLRRGISPEVHAIGDRAVRHTLDAFAIARKRSGSRLPLSISHAESVHPRDVPRFKQLDVAPAMAFQWAKPAFDSIDAAKDQLGPERFARTEPIGTLWNAGARVAVGSDWPVDPLNEWLLLQVGVTRENPDGGKRYSGRLGSSPLLPRAAAVRAITANTARIMLQDDKTGSLEKGKLADLIVLDRNLFRIPAKQIARTKVLMTMVGGKVVWQAKGAGR